MNFLNPLALLNMNEERILDDIKKSTERLGGEYLYQTIIDAHGKTCKRIIITYDNNHIPSRF
jgi:hypothetical protein